MDSDLFKIVLTSAFTVIGGVSVLVTGQLVVRFILDPIHDQDKLLAEVANLLVLFSNILYDSAKPPSQEDPFWQQIENASRDLRQTASQLRAATYSIRGYKLFEKLGIIRLKREQAIDVSRSMIGWSNVLMAGDLKGVSSSRQHIETILGIDIHSSKGTK